MYPSNHDVSFLGVHNATWRAVDCPTGDLPIQYAFHTDSVGKYYFSLHVWDLRVPVATIEVRVECDGGGLRWVPLEFSSAGFKYQGQQHCSDVAYEWPHLHLRLTSVHGEILMEEIKVPANLTQVHGCVACMCLHMHACVLPNVACTPLAEYLCLV